MKVQVDDKPVVETVRGLAERASEIAPGLMIILGIFAIAFYLLGVDLVNLKIGQPKDPVKEWQYYSAGAVILIGGAVWSWRKRDGKAGLIPPHLDEMTKSIPSIIQNWGFLRVCLLEIIARRVVKEKEIPRVLVTCCLGAYYNNDMREYQKVVHQLLMHASTERDEAVRICLFLTRCYDELNTPAKAVNKLVLAQELQQAAKLTKSPFLKAVCLNYAGLLHYRIGKSDGMDGNNEHFDLSRQAFQESLRALGDCDLGRHDKAFWEAYLHRNLGRVLNKLKVSEEASSELGKAIESWRKLSEEAKDGKEVLIVVVQSELCLSLCDIVSLSENHAARKRELQFWAPNVLDKGDRLIPVLATLRGRFTKLAGSQANL